MPDVEEPSNLFREFVEGTDDLLTRVDSARRFHYVNPGFRKYYGLEPVECIGRYAFDFIRPEDRAQTQKTFEGWIRDKAIYGADPDGNCVMCNPACLSLLGYDAESEVLGHNMRTLIHHSHEDGSLTGYKVTAGLELSWPRFRSFQIKQELFTP